MTYVILLTATTVSLFGYESSKTMGTSVAEGVKLRNSSSNNLKNHFINVNHGCLSWDVI